MHAVGEVKPDPVRETRSGLARAGVGRSVGWNMSTRGPVLNTMIYDLAHIDAVDYLAAGVLSTYRGLERHQRGAVHSVKLE